MTEYVRIRKDWLPDLFRLIEDSKPNDAYLKHFKKIVLLYLSLKYDSPISHPGKGSRGKLMSETSFPKG